MSDHDSVRASATRKELLASLADEGAEVLVSHFDRPGRVVRADAGFRWCVSAKEDAAPVE